jgi:Methyltransferase domain
VQVESFDPELRERHIDASRRRMPGPSYYEVLRWVHGTLRPANYLEIGVRRGVSLGAAVAGTTCIGVDPVPLLERDLPDTRIYAETSDEFFARRDLTDVLGGPVELAFIDGLHLFEQVLTDFVNVERHSAPSTVVLLHDCLPLDAATASRERRTDFYSGDVWKAVLALRRRRPELEMLTVRAAPTGLCLVRGLEPGRGALRAELPAIIADYRDLDFGYYLAHRDEMPPEIPNDESLVRDWLTRAPAGPP